MKTIRRAANQRRETIMPTTMQQELAALRRICNLLDQLDENTRTRAVRWLTERYPTADQTNPFTVADETTGIRR